MNAAITATTIRGAVRCASPDPLGLAPAPNPHAYVDNPTTWIDPLGLMGCGQGQSQPDFIVTPNGDVIPVPEGASGPTPVNTGKGFQFTGGSGGHGLDPRAANVRVMDPVTTGKYQYPNGYVSYSNSAGQAVDP